jgi:hypothetical protein
MYGLRYLDLRIVVTESLRVMKTNSTDLLPSSSVTVMEGTWEAYQGRRLVDLRTVERQVSGV